MTPQLARYLILTCILYVHFSAYANKKPEFITLDKIVLSIDNHPALNQSIAKESSAKGKLQAAYAPYDLKLKAKGSAFPLGAYQQQSAEMGFSQRLPGLGQTEFFSTYGYGNDFPVYKGDKVSANLGRARIGGRAQLWKNLLIDDDRAALAKSKLGVKISGLHIQAKKLQLQHKATSEYYKWRKFAQKVILAQDLLNAALERQVMIKRQVEAGVKRKLDLVDNERLVLSRKLKLVSAQQEEREQAYKLSIYFRDENSNPIVVQTQQSRACTPSFQPLDVQNLRKRIESAQPLLQALSLQTKVYGIDEDLAHNLAAPKVQLELGAAQQVGKSVNIDDLTKTKEQFEFYVGLNVSWQIQRRKAKGKARQARAKQQRIVLEQRQQGDLFEAAAYTEFTSWKAQKTSAQLAQKSAELTTKMEHAERRAFSLGQSNLINVNLRERASLKAKLSFLEACLKTQEARVHFSLLTGNPITKNNKSDQNKDQNP